MHRAALHLGALWAVLTPCVSALAHGVPPVAYAVLSADEEGARAVHLSHGAALRRGPDRYQFVCPSAWGDQYAAPLAALQDGSIVVGGAKGLMLLAQDGSARPHPDPVASGASIDLARGGSGVFALRTTPQGGSELLSVDAERARVLWKDTKPYSALTAFDDKVVVLRASELSLEQVTIAAADGRELDRQLALLDGPVDYVFGRALEGVAYVLVAYRTRAVLGRVQMGAFTKVTEGELSVAGPLRVGDHTLLAPDGQLSQLAGDRTEPLTEAQNVLCLAQNGALTYACQPDGISRVTPQALGDPLFLLRWLTPPDLTLLPEGAARDRCNAQWQDLRVDLQMAGTTLNEPAPSDAGSAMPSLAMIVDASSAEASAPMPTPSGPSAGLAAPQQPEKTGSGGCSMSVHTSPPLAGPLALLLVPLFWRRRSRH